MHNFEFVYPSYILTVAGIVGVLVWSWTGMRRAEADAEMLRSKARK